MHTADGRCGSESQTELRRLLGLWSAQGLVFFVALAFLWPRAPASFVAHATVRIQADGRASSVPLAESELLDLVATAPTSSRTSEHPQISARATPLGLEVHVRSSSRRAPTAVAEVRRATEELLRYLPGQLARRAGNRVGEPTEAWSDAALRESQLAARDLTSAANTPGEAQPLETADAVIADDWAVSTTIEPESIPLDPACQELPARLTARRKQLVQAAPTVVWVAQVTSPAQVTERHGGISRRLWLSLWALAAVTSAASTGYLHRRDHHILRGVAQLKALWQADVLAILGELDSLRYRAATEWWFRLARAAVIGMALVVLACAAIDPEFLQNTFHDPRLAVREAWCRLTEQHGLP